MADVNLVFPAPFRQQGVLFYGLFQQMGTSLILGLFPAVSVQLDA